MSALTADVPSSFDTAFPAACASIGCAPLDLLGVMMSESAVRATAENPHGDAVGIVQFMPGTLAWLDWTKSYAAFAELDATEQLPYVVAYYAAFASYGKPWDSAGRIYQATFLPGTLSTLRAPGDVLCQHAGRLGWAYDANATFDENGDGRITIQELTDAVERAAKGPRWVELCGRIGQPVPASEPDLYSILGVQEALGRLGYDHGNDDGVFGPLTRAAVLAFQHAHPPLAADGRVGPLTRASLEQALDSAA